MFSVGVRRAVEQVWNKLHGTADPGHNERMSRRNLSAKPSLFRATGHAISADGALHSRQPQPSNVVTVVTVVVVPVVIVDRPAAA